MKNLLTLVLLWLGLCASAMAPAYRTVDYDNLKVNYLDSAQVVDSYAFLGPYPALDSPKGLLDVYIYQTMKSLRDTDRGALAIRHAYLHGDGLAEIFSDSLRLHISLKETPALFRLITHVREDAGSIATRAAKNGYMRVRPFEQFGEHTPLVSEEIEFLGTGSYPSGHSAIGWLTALILAKIAPEHATSIMQCGYEIGQSRVILGFHYQSDVDAGRLVASMVLPMLMNNPEFMADLQAAQAEYISIKMNKQ